MKIIAAVCLCCLAITSCGLYRVSRQDATKSAGIPGIPILVKKPVRYQMTKVVMTHWKVAFVLKVGDKEIVAPSGEMQIVASNGALLELEGISIELSKDAEITPENFASKVQAKIDAADIQWGGCHDKQFTKTLCIVPVAPYGRTIENTVVVASELSDTQYFINTRRPWIGTASATIKLAPDGTMTEAVAEVEDKTVETLLSVLPITDFFTRQWGLNDKSATAATSLLRSDQAAFQKWSDQGRPKPTITLSLKPIAWTYVLRRRLDETVKFGVALTYPENVCGSDARYCVELVSATSEAEKKASEDKKPPGWTISGTVVPPAKE